MANGAQPPANGSHANGWKFEKRVSIDTVIAAIVLTFGIGGPLLLTWNAMDKRVVILETLQAEAIKQQTARDSDLREQRIAEVQRAEKLTTAVQAMQIDIAKLITIQTTQGKR